MRHKQSLNFNKLFLLTKCVRIPKKSATHLPIHNSNIFTPSGGRTWRFSTGHSGFVPDAAAWRRLPPADRNQNVATTLKLGFICTRICLNQLTKVKK